MHSPLNEILRILIASVFGFAALSKMISRASLTASIEALRIPASRIVALGVIAGELAVVAAGVFGSNVLAATVLTVIGMVFAAAGLTAVARRVQIHCACFGSGRGMLGWRQLRLLPVYFVGAGVLLASSPAEIPRDSAEIAATTAIFIMLGAGWVSVVLIAPTRAHRQESDREFEFVRDDLYEPGAVI